MILAIVELFISLTSLCAVIFMGWAALRFERSVFRYGLRIAALERISRVHTRHLPASRDAVAEEERTRDMLLEQWGPR